MTININGYTVEIKAKNANVEGARMNKEDTLAILNLLSSWAFCAADHLEALGMKAINNVARESARAMYDVCDKAGYYNDLR